MPAPAIGLRRFAPSSLPQVDWSHPLAQGLDAVVLPGVAPVDLVTGAVGTITGAESGATPIGLGRTGYIEFTASQKPVVVPPFSALACLGTTPTAAEAFVGYGGAGTGRGWKIGTVLVSGSYRAALTFGAVADYAHTTNWPTSAGLVASASVVANGGAFTGYANGARLWGGTVGTMQTPTKGLLVGVTHTGTAYGDTLTRPISVAAVWRRVLQPAEHAALAADPFCFLRY